MIHDQMIITIQARRGADLSPTLRYLERCGTVELQGTSVAYLDAGPWIPRKRLQRKLVFIASMVKSLIGTDVHIGASTTKSVSLIAARQTPPGGIAIVEPGTEPSFLDKVVIDLLPGIGRRTATYLRNRGVTTIGKFGRLPQTIAVNLFGVSGIILSGYSKGNDPRMVLPTRQSIQSSIGNRSLFSLFGTPPTQSIAGIAVNAR